MRSQRRRLVALVAIGLFMMFGCGKDLKQPPVWLESAEADPIGQDAISPSDVDIHQSPADALSWPITKTIKALELRDDGGEAFGVSVLMSPYTAEQGRDTWPDFVPPGWDGPLRYTLWLMTYCQSRWHATAAIEFWHNRVWSGAPLLRFYKEWTYQWDTGQKCAPKRGDTIGFFVTSGQTRLNKGVYGNGPDGRPVKERSNIVKAVLVENAQYGYGGGPPPPDPPPPPPPGPPPPPSDLESKVLKLEQEIRALHSVITELSGIAQGAERASQDAQLEAERASADVKALKIPKECRVSLILGATKIPLSCQLQ